MNKRRVFVNGVMNIQIPKISENVLCLCHWSLHSYSNTGGLSSSPVSGIFSRFSSHLFQDRCFGR